VSNDAGLAARSSAAPLTGAADPPEPNNPTPATTSIAANMVRMFRSLVSSPRPRIARSVLGWQASPAQFFGFQSFVNGVD
jgi:hypothetical protein